MSTTVKTASAAAKRARKTAAAGNGAARPTVALPAGYAPIHADFGVKWDYESQPLLEGVIDGELREVESGTGKNKRVSRIMSIRTDAGVLYDVWDSAALRGLFDQAEVGQRVAIAFQGYREIAGRSQPMKLFSAGVAPSADAELARAAKSRK